MKRSEIRRLLYYCGVEREEYDEVRAMIWRRNLATLRITSVLAMVMGFAFLLGNYLSGTGLLLPYLFLLCGSAAIFALLPPTRESGREWLSLLMCYGQMILVCAYAAMLSGQRSNSAIPATSVIVFIALLPQSIDDRPARMYAVMLLESVSYLCVSYLRKAGHAFSLDVMNVVTFLVVGMILYAVICTRNVRELCQNVRVERIQKNMISALATVVEERDENTGGHIQRTEELVERLAGRVRGHERYAGLGDDYFHNVSLAAPMHDIGKIRIPDGILNKPGRLTDEEFAIMKKHAEYGAEIIRKTMTDVEEKEFYDIAYHIARSHHERFDGKGYPDGLKGEEIPLEARIMALADVYDALVSERVYKKAFSGEEARRIIAEGGGTQFDPVLTELFLECVE